MYSALLLLFGFLKYIGINYKSIKVGVNMNLSEVLEV